MLVEKIEIQLHTFSNAENVEHVEVILIAADVKLRLYLLLGQDC